MAASESRGRARLWLGLVPSARAACHHACWTGGALYTGRQSAIQATEAETGVATGGQTTDRAGAPEI